MKFNSNISIAYKFVSAIFFSVGVRIVSMTPTEDSLVGMICGTLIFGAALITYETGRDIE